MLRQLEIIWTYQITVPLVIVFLPIITQAFVVIGPFICRMSDLVFARLLRRVVAWACQWCSWDERLHGLASGVLETSGCMGLPMVFLRRAVAWACQWCSWDERLHGLASGVQFRICWTLLVDFVIFFHASSFLTYWNKLLYYFLLLWLSLMGWAIWKALF